MPRSIRHEYAGALYHAMCRGNNGQPIFKADKGRRLFLATLEEVCRQTGWRVHAYVLMSNHYHLLLETPEANLVAGMKWFQGTYTQRFNAMFKCRGHLFQGRYKALPIEADKEGSYFRAVGDYIHLNPFRAGLAGTGFAKPLEAYRWSSFPNYVGAIAKCPAWLDSHRLLEACGINGGSLEGKAFYNAAIENRMLGEVPVGPLDEGVQKQLKRGWYIGGEQFRIELGKMLPARSDNLRGAQRRAHDELEAERLLGAALEALNLSEAMLLELRCNHPEKQVVAWLLKTHTTATGVWVASRLGMGDRSNVSRALTAISRATDSERKNLKYKMTQCTG